MPFYVLRELSSWICLFCSECLWITTWEMLANVCYVLMCLDMTMWVGFCFVLLGKWTNQDAVGNLGSTIVGLEILCGPLLFFFEVFCTHQFLNGFSSVGSKKMFCGQLWASHVIMIGALSDSSAKTILWIHQMWKQFSHTFEPQNMEMYATAQIDQNTSSIVPN